MGNRSLRWPLAAALAVTIAVGNGQRPAGAHAIESSLERVSGLTDALVLQSRFGPEQPASDAEVRLVSPAGMSIALGRTDSSGTLRFQLPKEAGADWELQVDQGPGHRDYLEIPAANREGHQPAQQAGLFRWRMADLSHALLQPQTLALAGLVALGGLGRAAWWQRRPR
jgi:hypothetical protein